MPKCTRCGVSVPEDKLRLPDRCLSPRCPLNELAIAQRVAEERAMAERAAAGRN